MRSCAITGKLGPLLIIRSKLLEETFLQSKRMPNLRIAIAQGEPYAIKMYAIDQMASELNPPSAYPHLERDWMEAAPAAIHKQIRVQKENLLRKFHAGQLEK